MITDSKPARIEEINELLEVAYIGRNAARDADEVEHWEGHIYELESELDWLTMCVETEENNDDSIVGILARGIISGSVKVGI